MEVLSVNPFGWLISISDRANIAITDNVVGLVGVSTIGMVISILGCILGWLFYRSFHRREDRPSRVAHAIGDLSQVYHEARDDESRSCIDEARDDEPRRCIEGDTFCRSSEGTRDDPLLEPKHKIFLSHSGAQKEFVDHLCVALENRMHFPFFDRRHESLPKGERFPELIVQAAEQCEMLIVVLSDEYFMSKWPMIELNAFVRAHKLRCEQKSSIAGSKILPLFYRLSVDDLADKSKQERWFQRWETMAKVDPKKRIVLRDWKYALNVLGSFNGIPYDPTLKEIVAYEEKIVSYVCKSIAPDRKWDDSHVQGKSSILEVIGEKIEGIEVSRRYKVKVVGLFGVGGVGKTLTCKIMCNELFRKYEGRVCHIEFPSAPLNDSKEMFQQVLRDLTRKSMEVIQDLNEGECMNILRANVFRQRTFLAIDNISDHHRSFQLAKMFLEVPYHVDSLLVMTARSQSIFELLGIDGNAYFEMPDLGERDAVNLFLHHAASGKRFFEDEEMRDVMTCVRRCYFSKGNGKGHHYHPLALQALGLQLGCHGERPCAWLKNLPRVKTFNYFSGGNPVFDILRSGFDMLSPREQTLFMDVGRFSFWNLSSGRLNVEWLCAVHKQDEEELTYRLEYLKRKGLLQDVNLRTETISMHDLYSEFAKLETSGSFIESPNLTKRMWVSMKNGDLTELESKPKGGCWHKLLRLSVTCNSLAPNKKHGQISGRVEAIERIKWDYFSNIEVLQLSGLHWSHSAFNCEGLLRLRVLELHDIREISRVEGVENLHHLTYFEWISYEPHSSNGTGALLLGQLPSSLKRLRIFDQGVVLGSDLLARCHNLSKLELYSVEAPSLDLSGCASLVSVFLDAIRKLQSMSGLAVSRPSNLQTLEVAFCEDLVDIPGMERLTGLKKLRLESCPKCVVPSFFAHTEWQDGFVANDYLPHQLRELRLCWNHSMNGLNLTGFNQLEALRLAWSDGLTSLAELGDLPALRCLDLSYCERLLRLPGLGMSRDLEELELTRCSSLELHEEDVRMLSELPLLQPVPFSGKGEKLRFRVDFARGKVLVYAKDWPPSPWELWKEEEWEERELGEPPIKIGRRGTWE